MFETNTKITKTVWNVSPRSFNYWPLIPLVHSFLTHLSISNFSEALWSKWLKYWGFQWEIRTTCKRKTHSIFSHGHTKRSLSYILLLYQSNYRMVKWLISIAERLDHLNIKKNLRFTTPGYVSSWIAVFLKGMWNFFYVYLNVWLMIWKLLWQLFS